VGSVQTGPLLSLTLGAMSNQVLGLRGPEAGVAVCPIQRPPSMGPLDDFLASTHLDLTPFGNPDG
jgi:hypothetical protein